MDESGGPFDIYSLGQTLADNYGFDQEDSVKMFSAEERIIRSHIEKRRLHAKNEEIRQSKIIASLKNEGYSQDDINQLYQKKMITKEVEDFLVEYYDDKQSSNQINTSVG